MFPKEFVDKVIACLTPGILWILINDLPTSAITAATAVGRNNAGKGLAAGMSEGVIVRHDIERGSLHTWWRGTKRGWGHWAPTHP